MENHEKSDCCTGKEFRMSTTCFWIYMTDNCGESWYWQLKLQNHCVSRFREIQKEKKLSVDCCVPKGMKLKAVKIMGCCRAS